ncbi:MAG: hypothetical protein IKP07_03360 [Bacilli bacterium]|nr:hypothetical protein [Bacilli bacterium]
MEKNEEFSKELETQYNILIKAEAKKTEQRFIAMFIILCLTLVSGLISLVFAAKAYFNTKEDVNNIEEVEKVYFETLSITYNNGNRLELNEIGTDYVLPNPKVIQITNEGNNPTSFNIKISSIKTSLLATNNLRYSVERNGEQTLTKELPLSDTEIIKNVVIEPDETITYTIRASFTGTFDDYSNYYNANVDIIQNNTTSVLLK